MKYAISALCCALSAAAAASATIIGTTGAATLIPTPADARLDVITSNSLVYVWNEDQQVVLPTAVAYNAVAPGNYNNTAMLISASLPAGTLVNSHYIHFDAPPPEVGSSASGSVTFDGDIIAVIMLGDPSHLDDSDFLGSGTLYSDGITDRGLEISINSDNFGISPSHKVLSFSLNVAYPGDFIRVLTVVPAPGSITLLAAGGLVLARRRRR